MSVRAHLHNPELRYMPQLDGLRGVGVLVVMLHHFATITTRGSKVGHAAMGMFFTLSSYLITSILLRSRERAERGELSLRTAWQRYFGRRARRIFPAYFAVLALAYLSDVGDMRRDLAWHATYLSNVLFQDPAIMTSSIHLWSLAVEEQFYLVWPLLILLVPRVALPWAMLALFALSLGYRIDALAQAVPDLRAVEFGTLAQADYLALGGLLALLESACPARPELERLRARLPPIALGLGLGLVALRYSGWLTPGPAADHVVRGSMCFFGVFLVAGAARGFGGPLGWLLRHPIALALGEVSYGAYLIHMYVGPWVNVPLTRVGFEVAAKDWSLVAVLVPLSLAWALLSFRWIEGPLMAKRAQP